VGGTSLGLNYAIPAGNPYAGQSGRRGEIWASGVRNPWRFSFDRSDGLLYIADVGQDEREEVDITATTSGGLNYGWDIMEGTACYGAANCDRTGLTLPKFEYLHGASDVNGCSITGGYVYRGAALPELAGRYFYSDYCKGFLKSFRYSGGVAGAQTEWDLGTAVGNVLSFGQDSQGELYMLAASGNVYRIVRR
jgi:glucose/arabinose dehydrogenase